jgi:hypothetical protein
MSIVHITPGMLCTVICSLYTNIPGVMYTMHIWLSTTFLGLCIQCTYDCAQHSWGYVYNEHMAVYNIPRVMCTMNIWLCTTFLGLSQECCTQSYVHCIHNPRNVVHSHMCIVYITPGMLYTVQHSWGYVHNEHMTVYNIPRVMCTMDIWLCTTFLWLCIQWTCMCIVYITPGMLYTVICALYT